MSELGEESSDDHVEIENRVIERERRAPNVSFEMKDGQANLVIGENSEPPEFLKLMEAMGTCDRLFISPLLSQIANAVSSKGELEEEAMRLILSQTRLQPMNLQIDQFKCREGSYHVRNRRLGRSISSRIPRCLADAIASLSRRFTTISQILMAGQNPEA